MGGEVAFGDVAADGRRLAGDAGERVRVAPRRRGGIEERGDALALRAPARVAGENVADHLPRTSRQAQAYVELAGARHRHRLIGGVKGDAAGQRGVALRRRL